MERRIFKMFWKLDDIDSIQEAFILDKPMRTEDPWLIAVLNADRYGDESWEMYCFIHGLPTRNVGSWLPNVSEPRCGNKRCGTLATKEWPEMWQRCHGDKWHLRVAMDCQICSEERKRRYCVIDETQESKIKYRSDPFTDAPFVHPFRHPAYHAQQLRSMSFAKLKGRRILSVLAHDVIKTSDVASTRDKEELRKEQWLRFHDRYTNGTPGLLPLVLDLPVRFTVQAKLPERWVSSSILVVGFADGHSRMRKNSDWKHCLILK